MTAWAAIAGNATVWVLVLVLCTGLGYSVVLAWTRWGGQLPLPHPVGRAVSLALGAPAAPVLRPEDPPRPAPAPASDVDEPAPTATPAPQPDAAAVASVTSVPVSEEDEEDPVEPEQTLVPAPAPIVRPARPARTLSRPEALAELSTVLHIEYEAAAALLDHGLWGFENYDEWTRSMRGSPRPDDVPDSAWEAITHRSWRDLEEEVQAFRVRQAALGELETLWGVGPEEAAALHKAGYTDVATIRKASTEAIAKVPGIGAAKAFQIRAAAHGLAPTP